MRVQHLVPIRQHFPDRGLADVRGAVLDQMSQADWAQAVPAGSRIAIGVGSRGIENIDVIVRAVVDAWKQRGCEPFLVPVMGSHGSASAEGQAGVLAHYGITEATMGAPVVSSLDVVPVGRSPEGIDVSMDRHSFEADGVMLVSRVKWHTGFEGKLESGIHKMMAIGLGKWEGAKRYHVWGLRLGLEQVIRSVGSVMLSTGKMLGGLAILEDAQHHTAEVAAVGAAGMVECEEELLARVKSWKANLPVRDLDLLIVDEIGKNISGAGMDTKVINRSILGRNCWPDLPRVLRIWARDLTSESGGNAVGIGQCDLISDRLFNKIDFEPTWINGFTASAPQGTMLPAHFPTDRICLEKVLPVCARLDTLECTIIRVKNTMELGEMLVSENLLPEISTRPEVEIVGAAREIEFDAEGALEDLLAVQPTA